MKKIVILLCLLWMGFIFYMSSNNGEISHLESTKVVTLIENTQVKLQNNDENKTINENKATSENPNINQNAINAQQANESNLDHVIRKNAHAFMYMILAFLISSILFIFNKKGKNSIVYILFACLFYAVTDEFHQSFVVGRTSLVSDVLVDFGGSLIGLTLFYLVYYKIYNKYIIRKKESLKI